MKQLLSSREPRTIVNLPVMSQLGRQVSKDLLCVIGQVKIKLDVKGPSLHRLQHPEDKNKGLVLDRPGDMILLLKLVEHRDLDMKQMQVVQASQSAAAVLPIMVAIMQEASSLFHPILHRCQ